MLSLDDYKALSSKAGPLCRCVARWQVINALDYGSAQDRPRLFIIGSIGNELPDIDVGLEALVRPTNSRKVGTALAKAKALGEVIADLEGELRPCMEYSPNRAEVFEGIPEGKNWRYIRDSRLFS